MRKRHRDGASKVLNDAGFKAVRYEPKVEAQKNSTGRTTYRRDCVVAVVNHQLPYHVLTYNASDIEQRKLWNFGRAGEADLFVRLLERVGLNDNAPRVNVSLPNDITDPYLELTHDEFENLRACLAGTNMTVIDGLHNLHLCTAAYNIESVDGQMYASGLDKCASCQYWIEDRDLSIQWLCDTCQARTSRQLAIQVHC